MDMLCLIIVDLEMMGQKLHICCKSDTKCNILWAAIRAFWSSLLVRPRLGLEVDFLTMLCHLLENEQTFTPGKDTRSDVAIILQMSSEFHVLISITA